MRLLHGERGTAIVEFALIAPILFVLVFGIVEFGRALNYYNDLTQIAGQGARAAAVDRNPDGTGVGDGGTVLSACDGQTYSIQCQLAGYYTSSGELRDGINVCIPSTPATIGDPVTVRAKYRFTFRVGLFGFASINLSSTQTERSEAPASYTIGDQTGDATGAACSP